MEIDTNNFILLGRSAGGQIVLSAAYGMHEPGVRGVIDFYGPTDMVWGYEHPANPLVLNTCKVMEVYLGGSLKTAGANYLASSAVMAADSASVPTLMIYGKNDALVAYEHGVRLDEKLSQLKVPHLLLSLPWATHGCDYSLYGPSGQLCTYTISQFLRRITGNTDSVVTNRPAYGK
jgi:acetyl esterase/lipase